MSEDKKRYSQETVDEDHSSSASAADTNEFPLLEKTIGGVILEEGIKSGGMSTAYKGKDIATGEPVVMKILQAKQAKRKEMKMRFLQDGEITEHLDHPNIVKTLRKGEDEGVTFIAYKLIPNARDLTEMTNLSVEEKAEIFRGIARGLKHAHENGAIHRDIKPDNILVDRMADPIRAVLLDWGIAKNLEPASGETLTMLEGVMGTPSFMSPEQAEDPSSVDGKTDLYSLACTAYAVHTGLPPQESLDTAIKSIKDIHQRNMALVGHRLDKNMPIAVWFQEALQKKRSQLEKQIEENEGNIKKKRRLLDKDLLPVSDDYAELWNVYLAAKDPRDRPSVDMLLSRLDDLIDNQLVEPQEFSEEEQETRTTRRNQLKRQVEEFEKKKQEVQEGDYSDEVFGIHLDLALTYDELVKLADHGTTDRESFVRNAFEAYRKVKMVSRFDSDKRERLMLPQEAIEGQHITKDELANKIEWYGALVHYFDVRKQQKKASKRQSAALLHIGDAIKLAGSEEYAAAASKLATINVGDVPTEHQSKVKELSSVLEKEITTILGVGREQLAEGNYDAAHEAYAQARTMSDALNSDDARERATQLFVDIERTRYDLAETHGNFYTMLDAAINLERILNDPHARIPETSHAELSEQVEIYLADLEDQRDDIQLIRGLVISLEKLEDSYNEEVSEAGEEGLPEERRTYFKKQLDSRFRKLNSAVRENVGPVYDSVRRKLVYLNEDIEAPTLLADVESDDPNIKLRAVTQLFLHYSSHAMVEPTMKYAALLRDFGAEAYDDLASIE